MGMRAPVTGGGDFEQAPEGKYLAVCNGIYMIGTQPGFNGADPKSQLLLNVELHKRSRPAMGAKGHILESSNIITNSFNEKSNLLIYAEAFLNTKFAEADLQRIKKEGGFDPETLLGKCAWIDLGRKESGKDKWKSVSRLDPEDDKAPTPETDLIYWDWTLGTDVPKRVEYFWNNARENKGGNFNAKQQQQPVGAGVGGGNGFGKGAAADDDDIPF